MRTLWSDAPDHVRKDNQSCARGFAPVTKNVLNCFPKRMAPAVKSDLDDIQHAGTCKQAEAALAVFSEKYGVKYPKGVACLIKDQDAMLAFFDFPAEHWGHLRTSNPNESVFATVRCSPAKYRFLV